MDQTTNSYHQPVLVSACIEALAPAASGVIVDGTFGGGGHTRALLASYPRATIIAIDRDPDALANVGDMTVPLLIDDEPSGLWAWDSGTNNPGRPTSFLLVVGSIFFL